MTPTTLSAELASNKTLEALAQVIRAMAPEVSAVSFHDFAADTLWLSDDFMLPEDHQLVEDSLSSETGGTLEVTYGEREDGNYSMAIPVRDSQGSISGAVRLSIDAQIEDAGTSEPLQLRLAPVFVCLAAEFERRQGFPLLISEDTQQGADIQNALHAERFELFLQPICSLHDNIGLAHYEVLLRLRTAEGTLAEPADFLARAAQQRLMPNIDRWVVRTLLVWLTHNRAVWARDLRAHLPQECRRGKSVGAILDGTSLCARLGRAAGCCARRTLVPTRRRSGRTDRGGQPRRALLQWHRRCAGLYDGREILSEGGGSRLRHREHQSRHDVCRRQRRAAGL